MKHINLLSLIQAFDTLETKEYKNFLLYYNIDIKDAEIIDLKSFITILEVKKGIKRIFNKFYVGYKVPQISKEFDLLRFGDESIINIELKNDSTEEKILKQLEKNKYYLSFLNKKIYNFTFVEKTKKLYYLNHKGLEEFKYIDLAKLLYKQQTINIDNIDNLFNSTDYLVSPFNSSENFIKNKYFLTHQQESFKSSIIKELNKNDNIKFFSITGEAGTGKTLLTYDIAKDMINNSKKVLIIHCGTLNSGHEKLNLIVGWKILPIKLYDTEIFSDYDLIIIDETQRIYPKQFDDIVKKTIKINGNCIFSYDKEQTLSLRETNNKIANKIDSIKNISKYKLSDKIRTNKEISLFIKVLFNKNRNNITLNKNNIELSYFNNNKDSKQFLELIDEYEWKVLRFTPSQYNTENHEKSALPTAETSHGIIGQEFDNVVVVIDNCFKYNDRGTLQYKCGSHYHPVKMLFQNLTRARKKVHLVIVNNPEILNRCLLAFKK